MTTGDGGHDGDATPGPPDGRPPTRDADDPSGDRFRITRRRALLGLAAGTIGSVGAGVGLAALDEWNQDSTPDGPTECGTMTTSVSGPDVWASPPLVVARLEPGTTERRWVRVVAENDTAGPFALRFLAVEPGATSVRDPQSERHLAERLGVTVGIGGDTLREGSFEAVFDDSADRIDQWVRSGTVLWLSLDWRLPEDATVSEVTDVVASTLQFTLLVDD